MSEQELTFPLGEHITLQGHFEEPVTLEAARPVGTGYELRVRLPDGTLDEAVVSAEEAAELAGTGEDQRATTTPVDAEKLRLLIESARIRLAYAHDPQFAVSLSGIRTLPHQIEAVYQRMLPQPRLRFLLADDPGAGKTIMAGLLIKELKFREVLERTLILCPAPLTIQWQDELLRWFGEDFDIISSAVDQHQLTNPWRRSSQVIASLDYAKQDNVRERVWQEHWDLVIIDEAHKCSARTTSGGRGRDPKVDPTKRYELALRLTHDADMVLLLTATPHHGDEDRFAHFLRLIDPDLFPEPHRMAAEAAEVRRNVFRLGTECPWSLRRLKEDLRDLDGKRLFPDRHATTVTFELNAEEYTLYKAVTAYINEFIPQQTGRRRCSAALARTVLQRRLASSTSAIHESLKRRLKKQQDLIDELERMSPAQRARRLAQLQGLVSDAEQDEDDLDEETKDRLADEYAAAVELDQLRREVAALKDLVEEARRVYEQANDSKLKALKECLGRSQFDELKDGRGKLLLFTEHRDTLDYLREHLAHWGYSTCEIHGGMNPHVRQHAQEVFRRQAQVCVATEAAGEGINLQFCHLMINYDLAAHPAPPGTVSPCSGQVSDRPATSDRRSPHLPGDLSVGEAAGSGDPRRAVIDVRPAADFLKSTYQLEQRQRCQEERQQVSNIVREYLEESFRVRIRKAQDRAMVLQGEAVRSPHPPDHQRVAQGAAACRHLLAVRRLGLPDGRCRAGVCAQPSAGAGPREEGDSGDAVL